MRRRVALLIVVGAVVAAALAAGCSVRTAGAPKGALTLTATFDDVQNLVAGHSVQLADVKVGSVTGVRLTGYRATVTMSIRNGVRVPRGTSAQIAVTSLLGENFVRLVPPPGADLTAGPFLANGARIADTSVQPQFEQVVGRAGPLIEAVAKGDAATIVDAGATALNGTGPRLNAALAKSGALVELFGRQRQELAVAVERLAALGRSLAGGRDALAAAPGELARATELLDQDKGKILETVRQLTRTARLLNDNVLADRVRRLETMIRRLDPVVARLGGERRRLTTLINGMVTFEAKLPRAAYDGQLLIYPIVRFQLPNGVVVLPEPGRGLAPGLPGQAGPAVPRDLKDALPDIDDVLGDGVGPVLGGGRR
ncbi:MAG TPA: MCE family protein [Streptosporangiaceae bacterium]|nr:MCE family protein [Streptosporangiaceae bacterium]